MEDLRALSVFELRDYVSNHMKRLKSLIKGRYITSIRNFFRYLEYENIPIDKAIIELLLTIANWHYRPTIILLEDEESVLKNFYKNISISAFVIVYCCIDNGPMEGFYGIMKCEIYHGGKHYNIKDEFIKAIDD